MSQPFPDNHIRLALRLKRRGLSPREIRERFVEDNIQPIPSYETINYWTLHGCKRALLIELQNPKLLPESMRSCA